MKSGKAHFNVGQLVSHKLFDYRGVIIDVDPDFQGTDEWYEEVARSRPPRHEPWYYVLVHNASHSTYVAERNLQDDQSAEPVNHPMIADYFSEFADDHYTPNWYTN